MIDRETINSAFTAIFANRLRSFLTVLGIVIGVTSVILLVALVSGLKSYITNQIEGLGSNLIFVIPGRVGGSRSPGGVQANKIVLSDATNLKRELNGLAQVSAVVQRTTTVKYQNKQNEGVAVYGVQANYPKIISIELADGRFFTESEGESGGKVTVIGKTVANNIFPTSNPIGKTITVANLKYKVIGVAKSRGSTFGVDQDNTIIIPLSSAQKQFGIENLNTIYVSSNKPEEVKLVQQRTETALKRRLTDDDFTVMTQEQTLSTVSQITGTLTVALAGIAAISLVVGGIGVMNIMLVSVTERTREIGLRKALGAKPNDIRNQFLIEAVTLSGFGGILGILIGIGLSLIINNFFQTSVTLWSIGLSFGFSMIVGVVFGVAPAIRASKLDPIQALRYE